MQFTYESYNAEPETEGDRVMVGIIVYRKTGLNRWEQSMSDLPEAKGMSVSRFATHAGEPGIIYAANNRGLFRSDDAGRSWKVLDLPWPERGLTDGVEALACLPG
jgi:hypothetical protein